MRIGRRGTRLAEMPEDTSTQIQICFDGVASVSNIKTAVSAGSEGGIRGMQTQTYQSWAHGYPSLLGPQSH